MDMEVAGLDPTEWAGNTPYFLCTSLRGGEKQAEIDHWKSLKQQNSRRQLRYKGRRRPEHPNKVCTIFGAYGDSRAFLKRRLNSAANHPGWCIRFSSREEEGSKRNSRTCWGIGAPCAVRQGKRRGGYLKSQPPPSNISDHGRQARALSGHAQVCKGFKEKRSFTRARAK